MKGTDDLSVVVSYRGNTVLVTAPNSINPLYDVKDALETLGLVRIDAVFVVGGEDSAVLYLPLALEEYVTDDTPIFCSDPSWGGIPLSHYRVQLGDSLEAHWQQEELLLNWYEKTLLFTAQSEAVGKADVVFCGTLE